MDKSPLCPNLEDHEVKTGRSSILKPIKPRAPFQELSFGCSNENNEVTIRQRRVSFSGKNIVKEFCSKTHSQQITHVPTYEESFQISDTSESNLNSTSKDSSINQSFFAGKLDGSEESNMMEQSMDITSNSVEALKPDINKNAERLNLDFESSENGENSANMSLTTVLPREARIKRNHEDQNVESDVPIRYANRCSRLYSPDTSGMDFTEAVPSVVSRKVSIREFETSMEMTNVSRLPLIPFLSRDLPKSEMELTEVVPFSNEMNASMEMTNVSRLPTMGPFTGMEKPQSPACVQPRKSVALDFSPAPIKNPSTSAKPSLNLEISDLDLTNTENIPKPRPSRKTKASLAFAPQSPLLEESLTKIHTEDMDLSIKSVQPADSNDENKVKPRKSVYDAKDTSDCSFASELKNDDMDISSFTAMKFRDSELSILEPKLEDECPDLIGNRESVFEVKDMDFSVASKKRDESCLAIPLGEVTENDGKCSSVPDSEQTGILEAENDDEKRRLLPQEFRKFSMQSEQPELPKRSVSPKFSLRVSLFDGDDGNGDSVGLPFVEQESKLRKSKVSLGFPLMKEARKSQAAFGFPISEQSEIGGCAAMDMSNVRDPRMSKASLGFPLAKELENEEASAVKSQVSQFDHRKSKVSIGLPLTEQSVGSTAMDMSIMHSCIDPRKSKASLGFPLAKELENEEASAVKTQVPQFDPRKSKVSIALLEQSTGSTVMEMSNVHPCIDPRTSKVSLGFPLAKELENDEASAEKSQFPQFNPRKSKHSIGLPLAEQTTGSAVMELSNVHACIDPRKSKASLGFPLEKELENEESSAEKSEVSQFDPRKSKVSIGLPLTEQTTGSAVMEMSNVHACIDPRKSKASLGFPLEKELENEEASAEKSEVSQFDPRKSKVSIGLPLTEQSTGSAVMEMSNMHSCIDPRKSKASLGFPMAKELENEEASAEKSEVSQFDPRKSKVSIGLPLTEQSVGSTAMDMSIMHPCIDPRKSKASFGFPLTKELENEVASAVKTQVPQFDPRKSKVSIGLPLLEQSTGSAVMEMSKVHSCIDPRKSKASLGFSLAKEPEEASAEKTQVPQFDPQKSKVSLGFQLSEQSETVEGAVMDVSKCSHVHSRTSEAFLGSAFTKDIENDESNAQMECEVRPQLNPLKSKISLDFPYEQSAVILDSSEIDSRRSKPSLGFPLKELENEEAKTEFDIDSHCNQKSKLMQAESFNEQFNDGMDVSIHPHDPRCLTPHQISEKFPSTGLSTNQDQDSRQNISELDLETVGASIIESLSINETCDKLEENSPVRKENVSILVHSPIHHEDSPKLRIKRKKTLKPNFDDDSVLENNLEEESSMCDKFAEVMDVSAVEPEIESWPLSPSKPLHTPKTPSRTEIVYEGEPPYEIRMKNIEFMKKFEFIQKSDSEWKFQICPFFFVVIDVPLVEISNRTSISKIFSWCNPVREKDPHLSFVVYNFNKKFDLSEISRCCKNVEQLPQLVEAVKKFWKKIVPIYNSLNILGFKYPYKLNEDKLKFSVRTLSPLVIMDVFIDLSQWETYLGPELISVVKRRGDVNEKIIKYLCSARSFIEPFTLVEYVDSVKEFCRIVPNKV